LLVAINVRDNAQRKVSRLRYAVDKFKKCFKISRIITKSTFTCTKKIIVDNVQFSAGYLYFHKASQQEDEIVDKFASCLREPSTHCEFHDA